jgi:hypothetical protein
VGARLMLCAVVVLPLPMPILPMPTVELPIRLSPLLFPRVCAPCVCVCVCAPCAPCAPMLCVLCVQMGPEESDMYQIDRRR